MMSHLLSHNAQMKTRDIDSQELIQNQPFSNNPEGIIHTDIILTETSSETNSKTLDDYHMDTPLVPKCLPGDVGSPEGREELTSPFTRVPCGKPRESRVSLIRMEFVE